MIFRIRGAGRWAVLAAVCAFASPASAQSTATPAAPGGDNPVVAIVDGESIKLSELISAKSSMPEQQARDAPLEQVYPMLLDQLVERRIVTRAAAADGIEDDPEVRMRLARARDNVLLEAYISKRIAADISDENLRELYQRQSAAAEGGEEEVQARHILLESEADARAVRNEIAKGADFAELAKTRSKGPSAPRSSPPG